MPARDPQLKSPQQRPVPALIHPRAGQRQLRLLLASLKLHLRSGHPHL